jgi:CheY-like chemotaxis protein
MTTPTSKGRRVLVVDDEANIAELVATALRYEGFEVRTAADGASALAAVRDLAPDLVVLDVMLPDADGFDLQARIRADGQHVPVLFLTARDAIEDRVRGLTLGADDYMTKPFSLEELVARVHAVLRRTSGAAAVSHRLSFADLELDDQRHLSLPPEQRGPGDHADRKPGPYPRTLDGPRPARRLHCSHDRDRGDPATAARRLRTAHCDPAPAPRGAGLRLSL